MIKIKYKALFTIEFPHPFYTSGKCGDIAVVPSEDCYSLIKSLGLRFLPNEFGATLYGKVKETDIMCNALPEGTKFSFLLKLRNNSFENISKLNLLKPSNSKYYFNNLKKNMSSGKPLLVADTASKVVSDDDLIPFFSNSFSFSETILETSQTGKLEFLDSGQSLIQTLESSNKLFNFSFNLNKATKGRTVFSINDVEKSSFFSIAAHEKADIFGVVDIFYQTSLPPANQFQNINKSITTKNYCIPFLNRSTKWRFLVTKKFNREIFGVSAKKTASPSLNFTTVAGATPDKFIITSKTFIPLKEGSLSGIKLIDSNDGVLIPSLPNPGRNLIKTEGLETFSDILITI